MFELLTQEPVIIPHQDYHRLTLLVEITAKLKNLTSDPIEEAYLDNEITLLAVCKLVDIYISNADRMSNATLKHFPRLMELRRCSGVAGNPRAFRPAKCDKLRRVLSLIYYECPPIIEGVLQRAKPSEVVQQKPLLSILTEREDVPATLFPPEALLSNHSNSKFEANPLSSFYDPFNPGREAQRAQLEFVFQRLPQRARAQISTRLRNPTFGRRKSAISELTFYNFFSSYGEVQLDPVIDGKTPDLLVNTTSGQFYCEVFDTYKSDESIERDKCFGDFLNRLNSFNCDFAFDVHVEDWPAGVNHVELVRAIANWTLKLSKVAGREYELSLADAGVPGTVKANYKNGIILQHGSVLRWSIPDLNRKFDYRVIANLREKSKHYSELNVNNVPFIVATSIPENYSLSELGMLRHLYGAVEVCVRWNQTHLTIDPEAIGFFDHPKATFISAFLLKRDYWDGFRLRETAMVFDNPFAKSPLPADLFGDIPRWRVGERNESERIVLNLH
jgi:hypothetical protein